MARALESQHFRDEYAAVKPWLDSATVRKSFVACDLHVLARVADRILLVMNQGQAEVTEQSYVDVQMRLRYGSLRQQAALMLDVIAHGNRRSLNLETYHAWSEEIQYVWASLWHQQLPPLQPLLTVKAYQAALLKKDPATKVFRKVVVRALDEIRKCAMPNRCIFREICKEVREISQILNAAQGNERVPQVCIDESAAAWLNVPVDELTVHFSQQLDCLAKRAAYFSKKLSTSYAKIL